MQSLPLALNLNLCVLIVDTAGTECCCRGSCWKFPWCWQPKGSKTDDQSGSGTDR